MKERAIYSSDYRLFSFYFIVRYISIARDMLVNISGSIAKGPRPKARYPNIHCNNGFDVSAYRSRVNEKSMSPKVNSDCNFLYMST